MAECSLSYAKIVQTSAMKVYFQIAECSLSSAKISYFFCINVNNRKKMNILVKKEKRVATLSALRPFYVYIYNKV